MSSVIGSNIKRLRRERKITQDALAAHLGITCQAVSKWERGDSLPDISTLVPLANFLHVSTDEILGMDTVRRENEIQKYLDDYAAYDALGDFDAKFALVQQAYLTYSDDFRIIRLYIDYLCNDPEVEDGFIAHRTELNRTCNAILEHCSDDAIRYYALDVLSQLHYMDNEDEKAIATLSRLPSAFGTRNQKIALLFESGSDIRMDYSRRALAEALESMLIQLRHIVLEDTSFNRVDQLSLLRHAVAVSEQLLPEGDYGFFHYHLSDFEFWMANRYVMTENPEAALQHLTAAFEHAVAYDSLGEQYTHRSPLLRGYTVSRDERGRAGREKKVESQMTYLEETCARLYAPLWNRADMQALLSRVRSGQA